ncbi:MAG: hypothetical protein RLZZ618_3007, partial [Pseudomonadota bacterium]
MKLRLIAAAAAFAAASPAFALSTASIDAARTAGTLKEVRISGASALRLAFGAYIQDICNTDLDVFFDSATGANHRAYSCTLKAQVGNYVAGTPVVIYKRDAGGSGQGVGPVAKQTAIAHLVVNDAGTCTRTANPSPVVDFALSSYTCTTTANAVSDGGISDVEPKLLNIPPNLASGSGAAPALTTAELARLNSQPLVQGIFGVAVNKKLYRALQEAQGIVGAGGALVDVPADQSTWTAANISTIPSLPSEFVRSAFTGQLVGGAGNNAGATPPRKGWNLVVPTTVDANSVTKTINICRRAEGSGTQAASNIFFAGAPCLGTSGYAPLSVNNTFDANGAPLAASSGTLGVSTSGTALREDTGTGGVETCLGTTVQNAAGGTDGTAYGLAVLGRENNPQANGGDKGYRFVKLDGVAPTRNEAKGGNYGFVYESTMQWNTERATAGSDLEA